MITLILIIIFGAGFGYFATQNTTDASIHFLQYSSRPLPLYFIILVSIGIGLLIAIFISFLRWFKAFRKLGKKERELKKTENAVNELTKTVHKLELKNTKLESELGKNGVDEDSI